MVYFLLMCTWNQEKASDSDIGKNHVYDLRLTQCHSCRLFSTLPQIIFSVKENGYAIEHYHKIAIAAVQGVHRSCKAQADAHGCSGQPRKPPQCSSPGISARTWVQALMNDPQWTALLRCDCSSVSLPVPLGLCSLLAEFHNGDIKTHFTVKLGKVTAEKSFFPSNFKCIGSVAAQIF